MNYCISLFKKQTEEKAYKIYVTRCLRLLTENTAKMGGGSYIQAEYSDLINPKPAETRTPEEIIGNIKSKISKLTKK